MEPAKLSDRLSLVFQALTEPTRRDILHFLARQPRTVGEIQDYVQRGQSMTSTHLRVLFEAGLVDRASAGRYVSYWLKDKCVLEILLKLEEHLK